MFSFQVKTSSKSKPSPQFRGSARHAKILSDLWQKPMCKSCIADLVEEETPQECKDLFSSVIELTDSLSSVRSLLVKNGYGFQDSFMEFTLLRRLTFQAQTLRQFWTEQLTKRNSHPRSIFVLFNSPQKQRPGPEKPLGLPEGQG